MRWIEVSTILGEWSFHATEAWVKNQMEQEGGQGKVRSPSLQIIRSLFTNASLLLQTLSV